MSLINQLADACLRNAGMLKMTIADFSDADMLVRPVPHANHALYQLGHMLAGETMMVNAVAPGTMPELPAGFEQRFGHESAAVDDPSAFPKKAQLLELFDRAREASAKWVRSLNEQQLAQSTPQGMQDYAPTVADLVFLLLQHVAMHVGQFQVIRRKLGKPILF